MKLIPNSKWVHIEMLPEDGEEEEVVLLPEGYKPESVYKAVRIVSDLSGEYSCDDVVILPSHMIRKVEVNLPGKFSVFHLAEKNHIMALLK
jgi:hypothetical protein